MLGRVEGKSASSLALVLPVPPVLDASVPCPVPQFPHVCDVAPGRAGSGPSSCQVHGYLVGGDLLSRRGDRHHLKAVGVARCTPYSQLSFVPPFLDPTDPRTQAPVHFSSSSPAATPVEPASKQVIIAHMMPASRLLHFAAERAPGPGKLSAPISPVQAGFVCITPSPQVGKHSAEPTLEGEAGAAGSDPLC